MRDHLVKIKEAIEEYKIRGIKPLEIVFEQAIGRVVLTPGIYQESTKTPNGKGFWEIMGYLAVIVTILSGSIKIGKDIVLILPTSETENNSKVIYVIDK